jgi:hypothetical protein
MTVARRLNPAITVKWMKEHTPNLPAVFDGLRKAGFALTIRAKGSLDARQGRARNGRAALARTRVLSKRICVGSLSALLRRSRFSRR